MRTLCALTGAAAAICTALSTAQVQTPLPGDQIPQFVDPLPNLHTIVAGTGRIELRMSEFQSDVLPSGFVPPAGWPGNSPGTWVWGYLENGQTAIPSYIGPVIVATRGVPTQIDYVNDLGHTSTTNVLAYKNSTDQTMHWADPANDEANVCAHLAALGQAATGACAAHYTGPIPTVPHLHGGEVPAVLDGGPDAWFTSDGGYQGRAYYTSPVAATTLNACVYTYPNTQEAAPIWFHDHTLGMTRLNVYAGLAGAYVLVDPNQSLPANLPGPADIVPLVIQDRMFDTNGQLYFPNVGINPEHPYWVPEFEGDTIVVNGKAWPYLEVQPRRYRFLFLNGSNARTYDMFVTDPVTKVNGPSMWVIGTDGGYLDAPVKIDPNVKPNDKLVMMPGERYEVIIDFRGFEPDPGQPYRGLILRNTARTPYPFGAPVNGSTLGRILQFRVMPGPVADTSFDPAAPNAAIRAAGEQIVRLVDPAAGTLAAGVTVQKTRLLTLNEVMGAGGPLEALVNNTKWDGTDRPDFVPVTIDGKTTYYSELPNEGETEIWEIANLTGDAHPIHLHLVQFQLLNRQRFNVSRYTPVYDGAFPGGVYMPGYGPPLAYPASIASGGKLGGNPDVARFLQGPAMPPEPYEAGWKDTVIMYPGQVTRIVVRWAPTHLPANTSPANAFFPFHPAGIGPLNDIPFGYVWHCHIIDHEDNEMMRPTQVQPNGNALRAIVQGLHY